MRLGGTKPIQVDVRIIAATNKLLKEAVAQASSAKICITA